MFSLPQFTCGRLWIIITQLHSHIVTDTNNSVCKLTVQEFDYRVEFGTEANSMVSKDHKGRCWCPVSKMRMTLVICTHTHLARLPVLSAKLAVYLPSHSIIVLWPVPVCTVRWQKHNIDICIVPYGRNFRGAGPGSVLVGVRSGKRVSLREEKCL